MSIEKSLQKLLNRKIELEKILSSGELSSGDVISFSTELSEITPVAEQANLVSKLKENLSETQTIINDQNNEKDFIDLAKDELDEIKENLNKETKKLKLLLIPKDKDDTSSHIKSRPENHSHCLSDPCFYQANGCLSRCMKAP